MSSVGAIATQLLLSQTLSTSKLTIEKECEERTRRKNPYYGLSHVIKCILTLSIFSASQDPVIHYPMDFQSLPPFSSEMQL